MELRSSRNRIGERHIEDSNNLMFRLYGEAARTHNFVGALSYRRSWSSQATAHYRSAFQFLLQQEEQIANREHNHEDPSQVQAYIRTIAHDVSTAYDSNGENPPRPLHYTTASPGLHISPYFMDEQGRGFVLDGDVLAHQVADRPSSEGDFDCISSAIVMFNLSLCHYRVGRYEQSLALLDLAAQCLTGRGGEPWAMSLMSSIRDNIIFISEVDRLAAVAPLADIIARQHDAPSPAA